RRPGRDGPAAVRPLGPERGPVGCDVMDEHQHAKHGSQGMKVFYVPLAITVAILVLELVGGVMTHSLALLADAGHVAGDTAGLLFAMFASWLALRPADEARTYGYHRVEVIAALANGALLFLVIG